jgi:hypothetical protein
MRTILTEIFLVLALLTGILLGGVYLKDSAVQTIENLAGLWEEKKTERLITSALESKSLTELQGLFVEVFLEKIRARKTWLETESILDEQSRIPLIRACLDALESRRSEADAILRFAGPKEVVRLIASEIKDRPAKWQKDFLTRIRA